LTSTAASPPPIPRSFQFVLFCAAGAWFLATYAVALRAARGIAQRFDISSLQSLLAALFALFLTVLGFRLLNWIATRDGSLASVVPMPRRPGHWTEWATGAAIGWALALATLLPAMVTGNLRVRLVFTRGNWAALVTAAATLAVITLLEEIVLRGYLFRRLIGVVGPTFATLILSIVFAVSLIQDASLDRAATAFVCCTLFGILLSMGYLRTHALWLPWGLHLAYRTSVAILFGLPILGHGEFSSIVDSFTTGPAWLSGGDFGLDAALFTIPVLLVGWAVLFKATRDYAWAYTHPVIVAAGYEVNVAPPAAHVAMEKSATTAVAPPPLVQILPATPRTRSVSDDIPE
jgi:membrane protease YdiL (CAAX protease family)